MWCPPVPRVEPQGTGLRARAAAWAGVKSLRYAAAASAFAALLISCVTSADKDQAYFQLEASPALVSYHRVTIQLRDSLGNLEATLYDDSLPDIARLNRLPAGPYQGGVAYITIMAYRGDVLAYKETRLYDGVNQEVITVDVSLIDTAVPIVPVIPKTDSPASPKPSRHAPILVSMPWDTLVSIKDAVPLPVEATDADGDLAGYAWDCGDGKPSDSASLSGGSAKFKVIKAYADSGTRVCTIRVWDKEGYSAQGKVKIHVVLDPPMARAGKDTTVAAGAMINLHAYGEDGMGPIVFMEWKIGDAEYRRISQAETSIKAPSQAGDVTCVLRVTDSDSLTATDTLIVHVAPAL